MLKKFIILLFFGISFLGIYFSDAHRLLLAVFFSALSLFLLFLAVQMNISRKKKITALIKEMLPYFIIILAWLVLFIIGQVLELGIFKLPIIIIIIGVMVLPFARKFLMKFFDKLAPIIKRDDLIKNLICIRKYYSIDEADFVKKILEEKDIKSLVQRSNTMRALGLEFDFGLFVEKEDEERAEAVLKEREKAKSEN